MKPILASTLAIAGFVGFGAHTTAPSDASADVQKVLAGAASEKARAASSQSTRAQSPRGFGSALAGLFRQGLRPGPRTTPNHNRFTGICAAKRAARNRRNKARHRAACKH